LYFSFAAGLLAQSSSALAPNPSPTPPPDQNTVWTAVSRDANSCEWQYTEYEQTPSGELRPHLHRYRETATGLNHWNPNSSQWEPSSEQIDVYSGGAIAQHGQHTVIFAADLATFGAIDLQTPVGQELRSHLLGLSYYDLATGKSVFIAQVTNSVGEIVGANQVWYENAFSGLKASVHYIYTRDGFEQNVVLEESPPAPEAYGMNSATTVLEALTEFIQPPQPAISATATSQSELPDQSLQFAGMRIGRGRAFLIGNDSAGVPVSKQWLTLEGRQFLAEQVPVPQIAAQLEALPQTQTASLHTAPNSLVNVVSPKRLLPAQPLAKTTAKPMRIAALPAKESGFVLDYSSLNSSQTNWVFQADTTYYISGNLNLYGTNTVFEGGTILKYATNVSLTVNTPVSWQAAPYRPVALLGKDDNGTGEPISGSTGNPGNNYYAAKALYFDGASALTNLSIENLRIANAKAGLVINGQSGHVLNDVQMVKCASSIAATNTDFSLHNALFYLVLTNFTGNSATGHVEQLTSDTANWLNQDIGANLFLTNCLLVAVTNLGSCTTDHVAWLSSNTGIFQTGGPGGFHYLATNSPYRDIGTTNISSAMVAALGQKTTYPPIVFTNKSFSTVTNFNPQAWRDTDVPDYGYHYDPLDYVFGGCHASNTMTFSAGTAVGWFHYSPGPGHGAQGIHIADRQTLSFNGTVLAPNYWARCNAVQEQDATGISGPGGITSWASQSGPYTNAAMVTGQFLRSICMGDWGEQAFRDDSGFLIGHFNNCEFYSCGIGSYVSSYFFTNCLFYRHDCGTWQGSVSNQMRFQNCTFHGGLVYFQPTSTVGISVQDSALEGTTLMIANLGANSSYSTYDYNAYTNASDPFPIGGTHDKKPTSFNWQTSWLGSFYLPTNSILIDVGHVTADAVGLYHFTTQTNQVKETNSIVDIGYHYVAVDTNGEPFDTDGDGMPDYLEDANGNGIFDAGDPFDWTTPDADGRGGGTATFTNGMSLLIFEPKPTSQIP
jgi:hypothetical protein